MNEYTYRRLLKARQILDRTTGALDLPRLAETVRLPPGTLMRGFREEFGESPARYLRRRRVERAKDLLAGTVLPPTEIGSEVGFLDRASFDAAFAEFAGTSPEVYRRRARKGAPLTR